MSYKDFVWYVTKDTIEEARSLLKSMYGDLQSETEQMQADCYAAGLTPEAAARLLQLLDELYEKPETVGVFPPKRDYLLTMLASQRVPKGIPTTTDVEAAKMQLAAKKPASKPTPKPYRHGKFSNRIKARIK